MKRKPLPFAWTLLLPLAAGLQGCGGGALDLAPPQIRLVAVSFIGYSLGNGPFGPIPLPTVFRDQALEFTFDQPLDASTLGGFVTQGGVPVELAGVPAAGTEGIPYFAFVDQDGARNSLEIRSNDAFTANPFHPYIVGRHRDRPDTVVIDPRVTSGNTFGLPVSLGFAWQHEYVFRIPQGNGFRFRQFGHLFSARPIGPDVADLPIPVPPFSTQPALSLLFHTGFAFGPDLVPPAVLSIVSQSGAAGTPNDPIGDADPLIITFSKPVTLASIDLLRNFVVRNVDLTNTSFPGGILVPGAIAPITPGPIADSVFFFTPATAYGPGTSASEGFDIEVRVGSFGQPQGVAPPILGLPTGLSGTQLALSNSLSQVFRTTPCVGCQTPASIVEGFDNVIQKDQTFIPTFPLSALGPQQARWNDPSAPSQLTGRFISGIPTGNNPTELGTRMQFVVDPQPPSTTPAGLFSPFDSSAANSGNQCGPSGCNLGVNPNGGSHVMHIYESSELGGTEDSLEQIEWSPVLTVAAQSVYPRYSIWCGVSNIAAPISGAAGIQGLNAVFDTNYTLIPYQAGIPVQASCANPTASNPRKVPCGGPTSYSVALATTQFYPFPVLSPCFDYSTSTGQSGAGVNMLFEQNIEPGNQVPNFNRYRSTNFTPVRRLVDRPISLVAPNICPFNLGGAFDIYRARFTFVGVVSQARSLWYDTGGPDPTYLDFIVAPPIYQQPFGTQSTWILEGTDTSNPGPSTLGTQGVYIDAAGVTHPDVLATALGHLRYFRFRVELRGNNVANTVPSYTSVVMAYSL